MKKIKHFLFLVSTGLFNVLPLNNLIALILRRFGVQNHKIYKDLKFSGPFKIDFFNENKRYEFKMFHFGGYIENETFWKGLFQTFERESGQIWIEFSKISSVIFDIGANTGIYSFVSKAVNSTCEIYAFEPSNNTKQKFKKNIHLNGVKINQKDIALGENDGEQIFYDYKSKNQTSASLSPEKSKDLVDLWEYKVKTARLDSFIEEEKIEKIDLIKMDVEMYEPQVLRGFSKYLPIFQPVIFVEVLTDDIANQIYPLIKEDYFIYQLKTDSTLKKVEHFTIVAFVWNYLLVPKSKLDLYKGILSKFEN